MMAEYTKMHLWLNTAVACLALIASGGSAFFAWRSYHLKEESIGFVVRPKYDCKLEYFPQNLDEKLAEKVGAIGFCWNVTMTNQSELRTL